MEIKVGTLIWTPRFCTVKISAVFDDEWEARVCGYTEPTYYEGSDCIVLGKSIGICSYTQATIKKAGRTCLVFHSNIALIICTIANQIALAVRWPVMAAMSCL